jgi:hypothetical protein
MKTTLNLLVAGMFLAAMSSVLATVRYVWPDSPSPAPPYTNWATGATTIQQAVDAAVPRDEIVVTNGDGAIRCVYLADGASLSGFDVGGVAVLQFDLFSLVK